MAQEPPEDASVSLPHEPPPTGPSSPGGFGPIWDIDSSGALLPSVSIIPRGDAELWLELRVFLGDGRVLGYTEGPLTAPAEGNLPVALLLPSEIDHTLAQVSVHVTAVSSESGKALSRSVARAFAYSDGAGVVKLVSVSEAKTLAGIGALSGGTVEDSVVGREVAP